MGNNTEQETNPNQCAPALVTSMPEVQTSVPLASPVTQTNKEFNRLQRYNALDAIATLQLLEVLTPQLDSTSAPIYQRQKELQAPALAMMLRGFLINQQAAGDAKKKIQADLDILKKNLDYITTALINTTINPNSPTQLEKFLEDNLGVEPIFLSFKGNRRKTWGREALEKIRDRDKLVGPIIDIIIEWRDRVKILQVLNTGLEPRGRFRTSYNIAATTTFRWSSSENAFWRGSNLQNITEEIRHIFISDPGHKLGNVDLSTGDSRIVALDIFKRLGDDRYLKACQQDDLHTTVAKLVWPHLPWTGNSKADRLLAERPFYRHYDYRFMCKKGGHGTNYFGKAYTLARQMKVLTHQVERFQKAYFDAFGTDHWHLDVIEELQLTKSLTNIFGYRRYFHGRITDESTWREAIAFLGQSGTAIALNTALLRVHYEVPEAQLLAQVHDSLMFQFPEDQEWIVPAVMERFNNPIIVTHNPNPGKSANARLGGLTRTHTIPIDCSVGWNWGKFSDGIKSKQNLDGLKGFEGIANDQRKRIYDPGVSLLVRCLR